MRLRVTDTVIIGGKVINPGIGNFDHWYAAELIRIGSAYEIKGKDPVIPEVKGVPGQKVGESFGTVNIVEQTKEPEEAIQKKPKKVQVKKVKAKGKKNPLV